MEEAVNLNTVLEQVCAEKNISREGDTVKIVETRPLSKLKRWRLVEVLERAK